MHGRFGKLRKRWDSVKPRVVLDRGPFASELRNSGGVHVREHLDASRPAPPPGPVAEQPKPVSLSLFVPFGA